MINEQSVNRIFSAIDASFPGAMQVAEQNSLACRFLAAALGIHLAYVKAEYDDDTYELVMERVIDTIRAATEAAMPHCTHQH